MFTEKQVILDLLKRRMSIVDESRVRFILARGLIHLQIDGMIMCASVIGESERSVLIVAHKLRTKRLCQRCQEEIGCIFTAATEPDSRQLTVFDVLK